MTKIIIKFLSFTIEKVFECVCCTWIMHLFRFYFGYPKYHPSNQKSNEVERKRILFSHTLHSSYFIFFSHAFLRRLPCLLWSAYTQEHSEHRMQSANKLWFFFYGIHMNTILLWHQQKIKCMNKVVKSSWKLYLIKDNSIFSQISIYFSAVDLLLWVSEVSSWISYSQLTQKKHSQLLFKGILMWIYFNSTKNN